MSELLDALPTVPMTSMSSLYFTQIQKTSTEKQMESYIEWSLSQTILNRTSKQIYDSGKRPDQTSFSPRKKPNGQLSALKCTPADLFKLNFTNSPPDKRCI